MLQDIIDHRGAGDHPLRVTATARPVYTAAENDWADLGPKICTVREAVIWADTLPFKVVLMLNHETVLDGSPA